MLSRESETFLCVLNVWQQQRKMQTMAAVWVVNKQLLDQDSQVQWMTNEQDSCWRICGTFLHFRQSLSNWFLNLISVSKQSSTLSLNSQSHSNCFSFQSNFSKDPKEISHSYSVVQWKEKLFFWLTWVHMSLFFKSFKKFSQSLVVWKSICTHELHPLSIESHL